MSDRAAYEGFRVTYDHMRGYPVSRTFPTREAAQEFIDNNALVFPLPNCSGVVPADGPDITNRGPEND